MKDLNLRAANYHPDGVSKPGLEVQNTSCLKVIFLRNLLIDGIFQEIISVEIYNVFHLSSFSELNYN